MEVVYGFYRSPLGPITVAYGEKGITFLDFCECYEEGLLDNSFFEPLFRKFDLYFQGKPVSFKGFPIDYGANQFRARVYKEVSKIPWGQVRTYKQVAQALGTSPRAVGTALAKNNVLILVPCHRVVAENGLGGYKRGVELKRKLLGLEGVDVENLFASGRKR
ncbi:MAG: methylated-DNA--[protein]-cysteine S-methyltransferase [Thermoprotei archaeon]